MDLSRPFTWLCAVIIWGALLAGCATQLPKDGQVPLSTLGYDHSKERDRHNFWLETVKSYADMDLREPVNTVRACYLFCTISYQEWVWGPYGRNKFWKWRFQPAGISQFCDPIDPDKRPWGVEMYGGTKTEENLSKETRHLGKGAVIEYARVEQGAGRIKHDAEPCARAGNMAGSGG